MSNKDKFEFKVYDGGEAASKAENEKAEKAAEQLKAIHEAGEEYLNSPEGKALLERNADVEVEFPGNKAAEVPEKKETPEEVNKKAEELKRQLESSM